MHTSGRPPDLRTRRRLLGGMAAGGLLAALDALLPAWAAPWMAAPRARQPGPVTFDLTVAR